jgi:hypothetical protein
MALLDKVVGAVIPPESEDARRKAREKAQAFAGGVYDWLGLILDHHARIEAAFAAVAQAPAGTPRLAAFKSLALLLTAHSNAEESVIYPALVRLGHEVHAMHGYEEQAQTKVKMAELEYRDPSGQPFLDELDNIRGAVAHHMYEEENGRLLDLKQLSAHDQDTLTRRFQQEFDRYLRSDAQQGADSDFPAAPH